MPFRALIADDHELFRNGLKHLLEDELNAADVREAASFDEALELLTRDGAGDLVLVDLRMPGMEGVETLSALSDGFPEAKIAVISALEERAEVLAALAAGVHGYIPKSLSSSEIAAALRGVLEGRIFVPASIRRREGQDMDLSGGTAKLTPRQRDVLQEMRKGRSSKEIARTLHIAEGTVKIHLAGIYRALGVRTRAEAIAKLKSN